MHLNDSPLNPPQNSTHSEALISAHIPCAQTQGKSEGAWHPGALFYPDSDRSVSISCSNPIATDQVGRWESCSLFVSRIPPKKRIRVKTKPEYRARPYRRLLSKTLVPHISTMRSQCGYLGDFEHTPPSISLCNMHRIYAVNELLMLRKGIHCLSSSGLYTAKLGEQVSREPFLHEKAAFHQFAAQAPFKISDQKNTYRL